MAIFILAALLAGCGGDTDTLVVGSPLSIVNGKSSGSAHVFSRNQGGSNNWGFVKKVVSSDAAAGDLFGGAVAVSGSTFAVGAKFDDPSGVKSGSVYVFDAVANTNIYSQTRKVIAPDGQNGAQFGTSISLSGDTLGVGAPFNNSLGSASGAAYIFERNYNPTNPPVPLANNWGMRKKLLAADGVNNDQFGSSVSIHGNIFAAGASFANIVGVSSGAAYTFERDEGGPENWGQLKKIVPADGQAGDQFGGAVSINNGTLVVGARQNDQQGVNAGAAYVYRRDFNPAAPAVPSLNQWGLIEKFLPRVSATNSHFAFAVSICSNTVVVGSSFDGNNQVPDAAYIFRLKFDNAPLFASPIPDQSVTVSNAFSFTIPPDLIVDADVDDSLTVSATLSDGSPLPPWLHFDPVTWTFSGTPGGGDIGTIGVKVTAVDQDLTPSSDVFLITVDPPYVPPPVLDVDCTLMPNLYEWAFATSPNVSVPAILVTSMDHVTGNVYLAYRHRINDVKLVYSLIVSTDFINWSLGDGLVDLVRRVPLSDAFEDVVLVVRNPSPAAQFFRIQVSCRQ